MADIFYGSDTSCVDDIGLVDVQITNPRVLIGQRIARILQTPRGALGIIGDDPNVGFDSRKLIQGKLSPTTIAIAQQQIAAECLKDEQVQSANASLTLSNDVLTIAIDLASSDGPFTLTLNVSDLTTALIFSFQNGSQ